MPEGDSCLARDFSFSSHHLLVLMWPCCSLCSLAVKGRQEASSQPSIGDRQIKELATLRFIDNGENVIFLGPPGIGKTHLAIALGLKAAAQGYGGCFITVHELMDALAREYSENRIAERVMVLCRLSS